VVRAQVVLKSGHQVYAIGKVYKRLKNGGEDRLEPLYRWVREQVGAAESPLEADGWILQGRHFARVGRPDLAARFYERALALSPAPSKRAEIEALRARVLDASRAAEDEVRGRWIAEARARLSELAGEGRATLAAFGVRVEHDALTLFGLDTFVDPSVRLAGIERLETIEQVVAGYAQFSADHPDLAEPWRERGVGLAMLGRNDDALECLRRAAALEPTEPKSYDHEGVVLARLQRFDEAIAALDRGLQSKERLGRTADAIASIERYLASRPGSQEKRVEAARRQLWALRNPGKERDPERAQNCSARALQRVQARALPEALALYDEAVAADPLSDLAWINRGTCLYEMLRFEEALLSFARGEELGGPTMLVADDRLLAKQAGSPEGLHGKARTLVRLGRAAESLPLYQRLLARSPEDETLARERADALQRATAGSPC
jgi:tetratricopeptide (TPR) repeat protein